MSSGDEARAEVYQELVAVRYQWSAALALLATAAVSGAEAMRDADPREPGQVYAVARRIRDAVEHVADAHTGYQRIYRRWAELGG